MEIKFVAVNDLRKGGYVLIDELICKIVEIEKSKPGKHGSMKARITGVDIFTGQKRQLLKGVSVSVEVPVIDKSDAQVVAIIGANVQLMDLKTYETFEIPIPEEFKDQLQPGIEIVYQKAGNQVSIIQVRSK